MRIFLNIIFAEKYFLMKFEIPKFLGNCAISELLIFPNKLISFFLYIQIVVDVMLTCCFFVSQLLKKKHILWDFSTKKYGGLFNGSNSLRSTIDQWTKNFRIQNFQKKIIMFLKKYDLPIADFFSSIQCHLWFSLMIPFVYVWSPCFSNLRQKNTHTRIKNFSNTPEQREHYNEIKYLFFYYPHNWELRILNFL